MSKMPQSSPRFKGNYGLSLELLNSLDRLGYYEPTYVQHAVLSEVSSGKDFIVKSETGSGKTAAFGIPIIELLDVDTKLPQVLVLTPTRELAVQVCEELAHIGKYKKIRCLPIYGKQALHVQVNQLKQRVHIAVGTPGRVADLIEKGHLKLDQIRYLVLDEADELLNKGFLPEVKGILAKLPKERQTFLFSATIPPEIETMCKEEMKESIKIEIVSELPPIETIHQVYYEVAGDWKDIQLKKLLDFVQPKSCLIFCNTQVKADEVYHFLKKSHLRCDTLHGGMNQRDRLISIGRFKEKEVPLLIATDLAARGIHVDELELVINYNVPNDCEYYVHRIGRTGRAGHIGKAITFVSVHEATKWKEIMDYIGYKVPQGNIDDFDADAIHKEAKSNSKEISKPLPKNPTKATAKATTKATKDSLPKSDITMLRIGAGKQKKIRAVDIVGTISSIETIEGSDIGIIDIRDSCTYVEIFNHKGDYVIEALNQKTIKGKNYKVVKIIKQKK
jgi:ATP-dependent RNA helicase DeaD